MPKRDDIKSVLVIGSGPIVIGQACEFDYSGTQACRVLREEGVRVILVNSNPATIMTDPDFADATYIEPITWQVIETIIAKERPDAILPTLGGQTALNAAIDLHNHGILAEVRRRAHRRELRGDQQGRGPPDLQAARAGCRGRCRGIPHRALDRGLPRRRGRARLPARGAPLVHDGRTRVGLRVRRERSAAHRRRGSARLAHHRGAARGVDPRVEGVRARAHARHGRQHGRGLLDRERRPGRRAHRRLDHRRPRAHAHRSRVSEAARHRHRHHPRGRRRHRWLQHPVRRRPRERPHHRDRDEPARLALVGARLEGDRLPDREDRREARDRLPPRRDPERHHEGHAGELRADPGLRRRQGAALQLREVPRRRHDAHDDHEVGRRGHGDRPQLRDRPAEGAPLAREARIELPLGRRAALAR